MKRTFCTVALAAALLGISPRTSMSQEETAAKPAPFASEDLESRVTKLEKDVARLKTSVAQHERDLETIAKGVLENKTAIERNTADIESTRSSVVKLQRHVDDTDAKLATIARLDPATGRYMPNLLGNMQESRAFRQEFQNANRARVVIVNDSYPPQEKTVYVNGNRWRAIPGRSFVPVAMAPVTVRTSPSGDPQMLNRWRLDDRGYFVEVSLNGWTPHDAEPIVE